MKHLRAYIIIALLAFVATPAENAFAVQARPVKGIDVVVQKVPGNSSSRQTAAPDGHGGYTVDLPGAGSYTISYADGPKKGQVIQKLTVKKAGPVKIAATAASE